MPPDLAPDLPAGVAVNCVLVALLGTMEANLEGAVDGGDPEHLHDFRVSVRRTRALLGQLHRVLPAGLRDRFGPEFAWLGAVTGPSRDFDVYLLTLPDLRPGSRTGRSQGGEGVPAPALAGGRRRRRVAARGTARTA